MRGLVSMIFASAALACTAAGPRGTAEDPPPEGPPPASALEPATVAAPTCPPGAERRTGGGEEAGGDSWYCARGDVRHGPFVDADFDPRERTWSTIRGEYVDGERHGLMERVGFRAVGPLGRERVYGRDLFDHGRLIRSNFASARAEVTAEATTTTRRFVVRASGLLAAGGLDASVGVIDVEVWARWAEAPSEPTPSVLRVEVRPLEGGAPTIVDGLLYPEGLVTPPETGSSLPIGALPRASIEWDQCDPAGCEVAVDVALRWLVTGPGVVRTDIGVRAVPERWAANAPVEVVAPEAVAPAAP